MAEIVPVTSEALEAQVRDLLPSQRGFGEDLQASNVITPIIDLTAAAQGTTTPELLQTALAFGSQTAFGAQNGTTVIANSPGFYRILFSYTIEGSADVQNGSIDLSDGLSTKEVWKVTITGASANEFAVGETVDLVVFLAAGESVSASSDSIRVYIRGSSRQIADVNGNLVNPSGFSPQ